MTSSNARAVPKISRVKPPKSMTPWISAAHSVTATAYKFRLEMHRKGGAIHVRFHKDSETAPGKSYIVRNQRSGFSTWIDAARTLIRISLCERNAVSGEALWRVTWNPRAIEYPQRMGLAATIVHGLDVVINPRQGTAVAVRMADAREAAGQGRGGVRSGYSQARANRRTTILSCVASMRNLMHPVVERCGDTRTMVGFTHEEKMRIIQLWAQVQVALTDVYDVVFNNKFDAAVPPASSGTATPARTARVARMRIGDDDTPLSFDDVMADTPTPVAPTPGTVPPVLRVTEEDRAQWRLNFPDWPYPGDPQ